MSISTEIKGPVTQHRLAIFRLILLLATLALTLPGIDALAHEKHAIENHRQESSKQANQVQLQVPDLELSNQDGKRGKFVSDFIGDRMVAFTFVYTTCTTICPIIDGIFKNLQSRIKADLDKDFALLTLTIDSAIDIPARLKEHTQQLGIRPGWDFLTGDKESVTQILKALEVYTPDIANHPPVIFVVDGRNGTWYRLNGFSSPELIEQTLRQRLAAR